MKKSEIEVRKLPKKSIITIIIMSVIIVIGFTFEVFTINLKMEEVLADLGHKHISNIKVVNKMRVEDNETRLKSTVYKVTFFDDDLKKECIGFVHRSNHGEYSKDIDCN
ncbi:hypothetical protein [Halarcobacter ebronensis]|uniref:Uncharacterized protein n=1 Tax=Halarcobacter ebronensis TaxID=1462615 RepID=A0A4Q1AUG0_9BACT|nr:hypothetical protein [Halarcobacter ebronensis]QKF83139.1 hypothetical protein AEBR_2683 [Halarcobacter ebronensis]RXK05223.1 hypothetical protein CRV07_09415 [Halarcobacter ebronensis]